MKNIVKPYFGKINRLDRTRLNWIKATTQKMIVTKQSPSLYFQMVEPPFCFSLCAEPNVRKQKRKEKTRKGTKEMAYQSPLEKEKE